VTAPESVNGVVCDTAAVVAIINDLAEPVPRGPGRDLHDEARERGRTLAVPYVVARKAEALYLTGRGADLLGAFLFPERYRAADDPLRARGARGVWWVERRRPERMPGYAAMLGRCGDPVTAYVAAYAAATGWPVATHDPATYVALLGRDDAVPMPPLPERASLAYQQRGTTAAEG
jgi:hypothetical protein